MTSPSFPAALDALANPGPTTETDDAGFELDVVVARLQNCVMAIEQKLGIGTSAAVAGQVLRGTGAGATAFGTLQASDVSIGQLPARIATTGILGSTLAAADFTAITQAFSSLELRISAVSTAAVVGEAIVCQFNGDTTASYFNQGLAGNGATVSASEGTVGFADLGSIAAASASPVGWVGAVSAFIHGYAVTTRFKAVHAIAHLGYTTSAANRQTLVKGSTWTSAAAITRVKVFPASGSFAAGSIVTLYGWP